MKHTQVKPEFILTVRSQVKDNSKTKKSLLSPQLALPHSSVTGSDAIAPILPPQVPTVAEFLNLTHEKLEKQIQLPHKSLNSSRYKPTSTSQQKHFTRNAAELYILVCLGFFLSAYYQSRNNLQVCSLTILQSSFYRLYFQNSVVRTSDREKEVFFQFSNY